MLLIKFIGVSWVDFVGEYPILGCHRNERTRESMNGAVTCWLVLLAMQSGAHNLALHQNNVRFGSFALIFFSLFVVFDFRFEFAHR